MTHFGVLALQGLITSIQRPTPSVASLHNLDQCSEFLIDFVWSATLRSFQLVLPQPTNGNIFQSYLTKCSVQNFDVLLEIAYVSWGDITSVANHPGASVEPAFRSFRKSESGMNCLIHNSILPSKQGLMLLQQFCV